MKLIEVASIPIENRHFDSAGPIKSCLRPFYVGHKNIYIKIDLTTFGTQVSNQHPNLDRFGSQLGFILGGFWLPSWSQLGTQKLPKIGPSWIQNRANLQHCFEGCFLIDINSIFDDFATLFEKHVISGHFLEDTVKNQTQKPI